jgi:antitoxin YefM
VLSGIRRQAVVGKDGKIEIQASELTAGTVVEVIVLVEQDQPQEDASQLTSEDTTEYLLSTEANRHRLRAAIQDVETRTNLISLTPEEWDEEYNLRS